MRPDRRAEVKRSLIKILLASISVMFLAAMLWADEEQRPARTVSFWQIIGYSRYWMSMIFGILGFLLLWKARFTRSLRLLFLPIIFFVFSILAVLPLGTFAERMGLHPSPVCTVTKPFLFMEMGRDVPIVFGVALLVVALLTLLGNKLFCGWVCPIGAIQELVHRIPLPKKLKARIPFKVTNTIRTLIFIVFILVAFTLSTEIYKYFNPFEALHWNFGASSTATLIAVLIVALFVWRPFCYIVCPLGLVTWVLEQLSLFRVKLDRGLCTDCDRCIGDNPCLAMKAIVKENGIRPDCFACGLCLDSCAKKGLRYGRR